MLDDCITPREAAQILGVSRPQVYVLIRRGTLASVRRYERLLVRRADAEALDRDGWFGRGRGRGHLDT